MSKPVPETVITHEDTRQPAAVGGHSVVVGREKPLHLDCGVTLAGVTMAYQTYGALNADRSNAILVAHALTGDQFPARDGGDGKPGWWEVMVGPGRPLDRIRILDVVTWFRRGYLDSGRTDDAAAVEIKLTAAEHAFEDALRGVTLQDIVRADEPVVVGEPVPA